MKRPGKTPPFRTARGEPVPGSVAEVKYVRLGGVDQWVMMRGEDVSNPPLILLHGGPGMSETSFFRHCNAALEKSFTVVYWDQRGAGKLDVPNLLRGFQFSQKTLWPEASKLNLVNLVPALQMPVFFFLGRRDHWVPPETSVAYFEALDAPFKKLVWFDQSGHEPFVDEPAKFIAAMLEMVRPEVVVPQ